MASQKSLDALHATTAALQDIRAKLEPLVAIAKQRNGVVVDDFTNSNNRSNNNRQQQQQRRNYAHQRVAIAQAAIALALGTVRFMGAQRLLLKTTAAKSHAAKRVHANHHHSNNNSNDDDGTQQQQQQQQLRGELNHVRQLLGTLQAKAKKHQTAERMMENTTACTTTPAEEDGSHAPAPIIHTKREREATPAADVCNTATTTATATTTTTNSRSSSSSKKGSPGGGKRQKLSA